MRSGKRMAVVGLSVLTLMILSMTLSMARSFPTNPVFLANSREPGAYTMIVPGTYGHLIPIEPFPGKDQPNVNIRRSDYDGGMIAVPYSGQSGSHARGAGAIPAPIAKPSGSSMSAGNMGMPMGNVFSTATASNHVDHLESDLRDAIRQLSSK